MMPPMVPSDSGASVWRRGGRLTATMTAAAAARAAAEWSQCFTEPVRSARLKKGSRCLPGTARRAGAQPPPPLRPGASVVVRPASEPGGRAQRRRLVGALPGELRLGPPEVAERRRLRVDRPPQVQLLEI